MGRDYVDSIIDGLNPIAIIGLVDIPVLGEALFRQDILAYIAYWARAAYVVRPSIHPLGPEPAGRGGECCRRFRGGAKPGCAAS